MLDDRDPLDGEAFPRVALNRADADREASRRLLPHVMEDTIDAVPQQGRHERVVARAEVLAEAHIGLVVLVGEGADNGRLAPDDSRHVGYGMLGAWNLAVPDIDRKLSVGYSYVRVRIPDDMRS